MLKNALTEVSKNLQTVEERFALGIIGHDIYERFSEKLRTEKRAIEEKLKQVGNKLSNPEKFVEYAFKMCSNLSGLWVSGDYEQRVKLQEIVFPDGLLFDKETNNYRTQRVNVIVELMSCFTNNSGEIKNGQTRNFSELSASVPKVGIEPTHPKVHDFESCASTSSATLAWLRQGFDNNPSSR